MDPLWIIVAFVFGFAVKQIGLPPLVGFLMAGFALNIFGVEGNEILYWLADFGIWLLLFSIGLKLNVKSLLRPEIWATASLHMLITVIVFGLGIFALGYLGVSSFTSLTLGSSLLIAFALSFSSTVFAVKILEENGSMSSAHGRIAIGILIVQDIFAVVFLTVSSNKLPSPWAFALLALLIIPVFIKKSPLSTIIDKSGHGELLVLLGVLIPFGGAMLFSSVGLKPDLGALVLGTLLSAHPKAKELGNAMLSFKDLFLVAFFLTIGLSGLPDWKALGISLLFAVLLPIKVILFYLLLTRFKLRARTATLTSLNLANYSEFGLIVGAAGVAGGMITGEWMVIFALALSLTFVIAAPLNIGAQRIYKRLQKKLLHFEGKERLPEDKSIKMSDAQVVVLGMGRTGTEVYNIMQNEHKLNVLGIDHNMESVENHVREDRNVVHGDITDVEFWQRMELSEDLKLIIMATSQHSVHMAVIEQLESKDNKTMIAALSRYDDEMVELKQSGVQVVFNLYAEAGAGYAEHIYRIFSATLPDDRK
ncbi:MAG: potassium transporter Kef [Bacteroidetes bacterium]|nr:MAG: potassium transporter Kef [Bacteroidota bacterium]